MSQLEVHPVFLWNHLVFVPFHARKRQKQVSLLAGSKSDHFAGPNILLNVQISRRSIGIFSGQVIQQRCSTRVLDKMKKKIFNEEYNSTFKGVQLRAQSDDIPELAFTTVICKEATVVRLIAFSIKKQNKKYRNRKAW